MKAARWYRAGDIRIDDIPEPAISRGMVKIRVEFAGICGSDLHEYVAGPITIPVGQPHPLTGEQAPVVLGHEYCGTVIETGEGVTHLRPGDRVCVEPLYYCGQCAMCRRGKYNLCFDLGFHGLSGRGGGFSEYTVLPAHMVHLIPPNMTWVQGALVEPTAVAVHAVRRSSLKVGDKVAVFGAGPIGLLILMAARLAGASAVYCVEISPVRAQMAMELGATEVLNPSEVNVVERLRERVPGGVDVAFEVTGVPAVFRDAVHATCPDGQVLVVSLWEKAVEIHLNDVVTKERTIRGTACFQHIFPDVIRLIADGRLPVERLVTKQIALEQIVSEGFESLVREKRDVKILVHP
ncbi:MAG: 2,3-butanediol dehydrogenase [Alicyclobacillaceae bacterium]|nr:2,3-butanediol dehydrogenase [Alicyclobacillaceae bacterium]